MFIYNEFTFDNNVIGGTFSLGGETLIFEKHINKGII